MKTNVVLPTLILLAVLCISAHCETPQKGSIEGIVLFQDGTAADNVQLFAVEPQTNFQMTVMTDENGHYRVWDVPFGRVVLYPYDLDRLYPFRGDMFLLKDPDRVEISPANREIKKNLLMLPKAGVIEGLVVSSGGAALGNVQIVLCHTDDPGRSGEIFSDATGHFRYVVPSGEPLSIYTRDQNYRPSQQAKVVLNAGETRKMVLVTADGPNSRGGAFEGDACRPFRPGS